MARIVILSFRDNDAANAVVKQLLDTLDPNQAGWGDKVAVLGTVLAASAKVEAVIARPTSPCRCPGSKTKPMRGEYHKTERFGWWVHKCNKPHYTIVRDFVTHMLGGSNNLLAEFEQEKTGTQKEVARDDNSEPQLESLVRQQGPSV